MSPKKKMKAAPAAAGSSVGGSHLTMSMCEVKGVRRHVLDWAHMLHEKRSCKASSLPSGDRPDEPWPELHGGTFQEVAARAWHRDDSGVLASMSLQLMKKAQLMDMNVDLDAFGHAFLTFPDLLCCGTHYHFVFPVCCC